MPLPPLIIKGYLRLTDTLFNRMPQPMPPREQLRQCKVISHRGEHGGLPADENTLAAFERAEKAGVWGIELDLRWTRDLEPVVFHDEDLLRVYGNPNKISAFSRFELKKAFPAIPSLDEVVNRFGKKCHLMIEAKRQPWLEQSRQVMRLGQILSPLTPINEYHLITLHTEMLSPVNNIPTNARVAVTDYFPWRQSKWIRRHRWAGLCGHFLLMDKNLIRAHHRHGQKVGTGYVPSRNCLFREVNRGVDWIFSNNAAHLQSILNRYR